MGTLKLLVYCEKQPFNPKNTASRPIRMPWKLGAFSIFVLFVHFHHSQST